MYGPRRSQRRGVILLTWPDVTAVEMVTQGCVTAPRSPGVPNPADAIPSGSKSRRFIKVSHDSPETCRAIKPARAYSTFE